MFNQKLSSWLFWLSIDLGKLAVCLNNFSGFLLCRLYLKQHVACLEQEAVMFCALVIFFAFLKKKKKKRLQWISPVNCIFCLWAFSELFPWSVRQGILPASSLSRSRGKLTHPQLSSSIADIWFTHFHSALALHPIAFLLCTVLSCGSFQENAFNF